MSRLTRTQRVKERCCLSFDYGNDWGNRRKDKRRASRPESVGTRRRGRRGLVRPCETGEPSDELAILVISLGKGAKEKRKKRMAAIRSSLQRDLFQPDDERLMAVINVVKSGKKKKKDSTFLCLACLLFIYFAEINRRRHFSDDESADHCSALSSE